MSKIEELWYRIFPQKCQKCGKVVAGSLMQVRYTNRTMKVCSSCAAEAMRESLKDGSFGGFF